MSNVFFYFRWFVSLLALSTVGFALGWFMEVPGWLIIIFSILGVVFLLLPVTKHGHSEESDYEM